MVDPGRVRSLLDRMDRELAALRRLARSSDEDLRADPERLPGVKYRFVVAIETCIDLADHIIASETLRAPGTFADSFDVLGEAKLIPPSLVPSMRAMAGFRNPLVHEYRHGDDDRVIGILRSALDDLETFASVVTSLI